MYTSTERGIQMNDTPFNFEKDHPELYAQVQYNKAKQRHISLSTFVLSILIVVIMTMFVEFGTGGLSHHLTLAWVSFSTTVTVNYLIRSLWR